MDSLPRQVLDDFVELCKRERFQGLSRGISLLIDCERKLRVGFSIGELGNAYREFETKDQTPDRLDKVLEHYVEYHGLTGYWIELTYDPT